MIPINPGGRLGGQTLTFLSPWLTPLFYPPPPTTSLLHIPSYDWAITHVRHIHSFLLATYVVRWPISISHRWTLLLTYHSESNHVYTILNHTYGYGQNDLACWRGGWYWLCNILLQPYTTNHFKALHSCHQEMNTCPWLSWTTLYDPKQYGRLLNYTATTMFTFFPCHWIPQKNIAKNSCWGIQTTAWPVCWESPGLCHNFLNTAPL